MIGNKSMVSEFHNEVNLMLVLCSIFFFEIFFSIGLRLYCTFRVACFRVVRFTDGITLNNQYGSGTGQIWLDDIQCIGDETSLFNCRHNGWGIHNCGHGEDVSIRCTTATGKVYYDVECFSR